MTPTSDVPSPAEIELRRRLDALDHRAPRRRRPVEQVDVDPRPADEHVHEQPTAVGRHRDIGPRLRVGVLGPHDRVVAASGRRGRDDGRCGGTRRPRGSACRRSPSCRAPTPRCTPGCRGSLRRDRGRRRWRARAARSALDPPSLVPTATSEPSGDASNQSMAFAESAVPTAGSTSTPPRRRDRRPTSRQHELLGAGRALEAEQPVATDLRAMDDRAAASTRRGARATGPLGPGVERPTGVRVLRRHPFLHLGRVSRPPASGRGRAPPRRGGCRRRRRAWSAAARSSLVVSRAPCWGACRGWPWIGASGPCSSWSSWTSGIRVYGWPAPVALALRRAGRPRWPSPARARRARPSGRTW